MQILYVISLIPSRFSSKRSFSVKVLATSRSSSAVNTIFSEGEKNCKLYEHIRLKNKSGTCSSTSVSGGYSILFNKNERKLIPR